MSGADGRFILPAVLGFVTVLAIAVAPPAKAEFRWDAPAGCPSAEQVVADLETELGRPLATFEGQHISVIARVRPQGEGWALKLWSVTLDSTQERDLQTQTCTQAAEAAVLVAAMAIDPPPEDQPEPESEREPEPVAQPAPATEPEREPKPAPEAELVPDGTRWTWAIGAHAGPSWGATPGVGALAGLRVAVERRAFRVELDGRYGFVREARFGDRPNEGADFRHAFAVARGCGVLRHHRPTRLLFCGGLEAGTVHGKGAGLATVRADTVPWLAAQARAALSWSPVPWLALEAGVEPWVAALRPRFSVQPYGEIWRPQPAGIRGILGVEFRLGEISSRPRNGSPPSWSLTARRHEQP